MAFYEIADRWNGYTITKNDKTMTSDEVLKELTEATEPCAPLGLPRTPGSVLRVFIEHVQRAKMYLDSPDMGNTNYGKASLELRKATKLMPVVLRGNE